MQVVDIEKIVDLHEHRNTLWHSQNPEITQTGYLEPVEDNHKNNFLLWHKEDEARRDDMGFEYVYNAKRAIDGYNQARNNCMERIDQAILETIPAFPQNIPYNSENPGMIVDRLSILSLKIYHMREETERTDVSQEHIDTCAKKLQTVMRQRDHLKAALKNLLDEAAQGKRGFRVYFQMKMYNDPALNPQLYKNKSA